MAAPALALVAALTLAGTAATPLLMAQTQPSSLPADVLYEAVGRWYAVDASSGSTICTPVDISQDSDERDRLCFSIDSSRSICSNISTPHDGWISPMGDLMTVLYKTERLLVLGYEGLPEEDEATCFATVLAREPFPSQADLDALRRHLQSAPHVFDLWSAEHYRSCLHFSAVPASND